jgi:hypothetical protein
MNEQQLDAVKLALDGLIYASSYCDTYDEIDALKSIIAQHALDKKAENARELGLTYDDAPAPVQSAERGEPVAWMDVDENGAMSSLRYWSEPDNRHEVPLYTTPPIVATPLAAQQKRPPNCGTGYCSCIECVVEPVAHCEAGPDYCPQCLKEEAQPAAWVGLTNNEIALIHADYPNPQGFARAIEAKLKAKNERKEKNT